MYELTESFITALDGALAHDSERRALIATILDRIVDLSSNDHDASGLRVAATALNELLEAAEVFEPWRSEPKVAVFGSARTPSSNELYQMAIELSQRLAAKGWFTITGAGPGIMEGSARGAGSSHALGVNIDLPFEQQPSEYIDIESKLVTMQYFFTRKVALTRPSNAFVIFPGGFGTMDEAFEVLTLVHTGKTTPAPIILIDTPNGHFWRRWREFVETELASAGYIGPDDLVLVDIVSSVDEAIAVMEKFFSNYASVRIDAGRAYIGTNRPIPEEAVMRLKKIAAVFNEGNGWVLEEPTTISCNFDGRNYVKLRHAINVLNEY
jgi:uncharacterized protein (TIGR00730 family)